MTNGARQGQDTAGGAEPYILDIRETDQSYMDLNTAPVGPWEGSISCALAALDFGPEDEEAAPAGPAP